jgi:di/tricarboxylate transporter
MEIALVIGLLLLSIALFASEKIPVDVITVGLLLVLLFAKILTPAEALAGFGSDFIAMLASIFVIGAAMQKAGLLELIGQQLFKMTKNALGILPLLIMSVVSATSAFMNNTTVTAMFVPPVIALSRRLKISPSKLLMPVAFASIIGGTCTVIGTSTNVAVNAYLDSNGYEPFGMFDFSIIGIILSLVGIAFMSTIGYRMMPDNKDVDMVQELEDRHYLTELRVNEEAEIVNQRIIDSDLSKRGFRILNLIRHQQNIIPEAHTVVEAGDTLIVEGKMDELIKILGNRGINVYEGSDVSKDMISDDIQVAELLVMPFNDFLGATIKAAHFKTRFGISIIAVNREGEMLVNQLGEVVIKTGDRILIQGPVATINYRKERGDFVILQELRNDLVHIDKPKALISGGIFLAAILLGTFEIIPTSVAFIMAAFLCVITNCIKPDEAYQKIEWNLLVLIGGMTAFGLAMKKTGAADYLAGLIVNGLSDWGVLAVLGAFSLLTIFLTQPMSNAAAAMVVLPVALEAAEKTNSNPIAFALVIMLSASISLITPFEPSCILVYGPGRYKFFDFFKTGIVLTLIFFVLIMVLVPLFYPL